MKKTLLLLLIIAVVPAMAQQPVNVSTASSVKIEGMAGKLKNGTVIQFRLDSENKTYDAVINDGRFTQNFEGVDGEICALILNGKENSVFLTPGVVNVNIPDTLIGEAVVTGNASATEFDRFYARLFTDKTRTDWVAYSKVSPDLNSKESLDKHNAFRKAYYKRSSELAMEYIKEKPKSAINTYLLYSAIQMEESTELDIKNTLALIPETSLADAYGKKLRFIVDSIFVGGTAPDFVQNNVDGQPVGLKSYRGKYVLVDFWASWCVPCRAENPNVLRVYNKFKGENFDILAVSLDDKKDAWLAAVQKDGLPWMQVSDLGVGRTGYPGSIWCVLCLTIF